MSESQLAEALRSALDEETAGLTARPDAARLARRHGRRRKVTRGLVAGVPAVALVAGGAAFAAHGTGTSSPAASHLAAVDAAYVTKHVESQLSSSSLDKYILKSTSSTASGFTDFDPVTGNQEWVEKPAPDTVTEWAIAQPNGTYEFTDVDTAAKTVSTSNSGPVTTFPSGVKMADGRIIGDNPAQSPSQLKQALATGVGTIAGKSVIDGQQVTDLREYANTKMVWDFWVNTQTFQLVKVVVTTTDENENVSTYTADFLPRTKSLAAQVNTPQIPPGFTRVPASR